MKWCFPDTYCDKDTKHRRERLTSLVRTSDSDCELRRERIWNNRLRQYPHRSVCWRRQFCPWMDWSSRFSRCISLENVWQNEAIRDYYVEKIFDLSPLTFYCVYRKNQNIPFNRSVSSFYISFYTRNEGREGEREKSDASSVKWLTLQHTFLIEQKSLSMTYGFLRVMTRWETVQLATSSAIFLTRWLTPYCIFVTFLSSQQRNISLAETTINA